MAVPKSWRILAVLGLTLAWLTVLYCLISSRPISVAIEPSSSSSKIEYRAKATTSWEQEDSVQLDGLIDEVVEELHKAAKNETSSSSSSSCPSPASAAVTTKLLPVGQSLHSLVLHSVSRVSLTELRLVGLVSVQLRQRNGDPVHGCAWVPRAGLEATTTLATRNESSVVWGSAAGNYVNESVVVYDVTGIRCTFQDPVGANAEGGVLVLNVTSLSQGSQRYELVSVFEEKPEELTRIQFEGPFKYDYAYCSVPVRNVSSKFVKEWLLYHQSVWDGKVHYFIYDVGGVDPSLLKVFRPLLDAGVLTVVDMKQEALKFELVLHQLAISDCLRRSRFLATWAMFWDFDEYLQLLDSEVGSFSSLLRRFESKKPWVSLGTMLWSRTYCDYERGEDRRWAVERMNFRLRFPTCMNESRAHICHGVEGQRKWVANPREVFMGSVHRTLDPEWNGEILDANLARLNHFHELESSGSGSKNCWILKNAEELNESEAVDGWWWKDVSLARQARQGRFNSAS